VAQLLVWALLLSISNSACFANTPARSVLGSCSDYFQKRTTGFKDDPCTLKRPNGQQLLVVEVEEELVEAAHDVVRLMYQGTVPPDLNAEQLAKVKQDDASDLLWCACM
jgi:hypothetical protein